MIILANKDPRDNEFTIRGNIVHFSSVKSKRVTRSVLTSEVYRIVVGVNIRYVIRLTLKVITERLALPEILTIVYIDSYSLYKYLVKLGST